jgi:histidinol-phosphate aminotransferase
MISAKYHLKDIYRIDPRQREGYLRLDMNESVSGMPDRLIKNILSKIDSNFLAMYPEYNRLIKKIVSHNRLNHENICLSNGSDAAIKYC